MILNRSTAEQADLADTLDSPDFSNDWGSNLTETGILPTPDPDLNAVESATTITFKGNVYKEDPCDVNPDMCATTECSDEDPGVCSNEPVRATLCVSNANCQRNFYCSLNGCLECPDEDIFSEFANLESGDYTSRMNCEACTQYTTESPPTADPTVT